MRPMVAVALAVTALGAAVYFGSPRPTTPGSSTGVAATATKCLRTRGWNVAELSADRFVATQGPYKLTWDSGQTAFRWRPAWTHTRLIARAAQTGFACFPTFRLPL